MLSYWEVSMKPEFAGRIKFGVWGVILGSIITMIIGFGWGGWTTAGTTQKMAEEAVSVSQAAICVAQFMKCGRRPKRMQNQRGCIR